MLAHAHTHKRTHAHTHTPTHPRTHAHTQFLRGMYQLRYTTELHKPSPWADLEKILGGVSET